VPLLEREAQLASLGEYAGEAQLGDGRLVLIAGRRASASRRWLSTCSAACREPSGAGACDGLFTPRPLGPLLDIASTLGGELLELSRADWRLAARAGGEHDGPGLMPCTELAFPLWVVLGQAPAAETVIGPAGILPG
jgi:hypothetical protein